MFDDLIPCKPGFFINHLHHRPTLKIAFVEIFYELSFSHSIEIVIGAGFNSVC